MSAHTPGPWSMRPDTGLEIFGADGEWLMSVHRPVEELRANACLIAAAPDLLAELRSILVALPSHSPDCRARSVGGSACCFYAERSRAARAAIAKAEGKP
jgi:hypothetical protein